MKHLYIVETERFDQDCIEYDENGRLWGGPADVEDEVFRSESETPDEAIRFAEAFKLEPYQIIAVRQVADGFDWDDDEAWEKNGGPDYENVYWRAKGA